MDAKLVINRKIGDLYEVLVIGGHGVSAVRVPRETVMKMKKAGMKI
jgi:hypothetical protein